MSLSFSFQMYAIDLFSLLIYLKTSTTECINLFKKNKFKSTMLNKKCYSGHPYLFLILKEILLLFAQVIFPLEVFIDILYQVKEIPFYFQSA